MEKIIKNKKLFLEEEFKKRFPEYKVSKKGNLYYEKVHFQYKLNINKINFHNVTKNNFMNLQSDKFQMKKKNSDVFLICGNKLLYKNSHRFETVNRKFLMKHYSSISKDKDTKNFLDMYFLDKKYKYIMNYPELSKFNIFYSFENINEVIDFFHLENFEIEKLKKVLVYCPNSFFYFFKCFKSGKMSQKDYIDSLNFSLKQPDYKIESIAYSLNSQNILMNVKIDENNLNTFDDMFVKSSVTNDVNV